MALAVSEAWHESSSADAAELVNPVASAQAAGLRYVSDQSPGIRRKRVGKGFTYLESDGRTIRLLEDTRIRIGNDEYRKENGSYGLTTLRNRHVNVIGAEVRFTFPGKSGKQHSVELHDRRMARSIKRFLEIPGQELFKYVDGDGEVKAIDSADVNEYLQQISGEDFTAKDF